MNYIKWNSYNINQPAIVNNRRFATFDRIPGYDLSLIHRGNPAYSKVRNDTVALDLEDGGIRAGESKVLNKLFVPFRIPDATEFVINGQLNTTDTYQKTVFMCMYDSLNEENKDFFDFPFVKFESEGVFGAVFKCVHVSDPSKYLFLKVVLVPNKSLFKKEVDAQFVAQEYGYAPRIVAVFYGSKEKLFKDDGKNYTVCCVVMESGGTIKLERYVDILANSYTQRALPDPAYYKLMGQHLKAILDRILFAIEDMCQRGLIHGDTHFGNVLVQMDSITGQEIDDPDNWTYDENELERLMKLNTGALVAPYVKIIDFGEANPNECKYNRFMIDLCNGFKLLNEREGIGYNAVQNIMVQWMEWSSSKPILLGNTPEERAANIMANDVYVQLGSWVNTDQDNPMNVAIAEKIDALSLTYRQAYTADLIAKGLK